MRKLFLLTHMPGSGWVEGKSRSEQRGWRAHADFMNELAARGFILLGGPISDSEALLVIDAADEVEIHKVFSDDPWHISKTLAVKEIREWTILLEHGQDHPT
ncbi:MAG TPA: YciI family protein [Pyrinomonadaceae bacterium]|nr:YciI family protein [Pyrinomonadaceae bacterium]